MEAAFSSSLASFSILPLWITFLPNNDLLLLSNNSYICFKHLPASIAHVAKNANFLIFSLFFKTYPVGKKENILVNSFFFKDCAHLVIFAE